MMINNKIFKNRNRQKDVCGQMKRTFLIKTEIMIADSSNSKILYHHAKIIFEYHHYFFITNF